MLPPHRYALSKHPQGDYCIVRLGKGARVIKRFSSLTAAFKAYKAGLKAWDDHEAAKAPIEAPNPTVPDEPPIPAFHDPALYTDEEPAF